MSELRGRLRRVEQVLAVPALCQTCGGRGRDGPPLFVHPPGPHGWRPWGGQQARVVRSEEELAGLLLHGRCRGCRRIPKLYALDPDRV